MYELIEEKKGGRAKNPFAEVFRKENIPCTRFSHKGFVHRFSIFATP